LSVQANKFEHGVVGKGGQRSLTRGNLSDDVDESDLFRSQVDIGFALESTATVVELGETGIEVVGADTLIVPQLLLEPDLADAVVVEA
jgi:hypothetical protein